MLKLWAYVIVLIVLCAVGLAIGAANDAVVTFDFLIVKLQVNLATVLVFGTIFGMILGIYISFLMCFKFWRKASRAKGELKALRKQQGAAEKAGD